MGCEALRWIVERCFASLGRNPRLARNFEAPIAYATAYLYAASAMLLIRRLGRSNGVQSQIFREARREQLQSNNSLRILLSPIGP